MHLLGGVRSLGDAVELVGTEMRNTGQSVSLVLLKYLF